MVGGLLHIYAQLGLGQVTAVDRNAFLLVCFLVGMEAVFLLYTGGAKEGLLKTAT